MSNNRFNACLSPDSPVLNTSIKIQTIDAFFGLATLLERVNCLLFEVNFQIIILIYLWVLLRFKVGDNGVVVSCKDILSLNTGTLSIWSWHSLHLHSPTCPTTSTSTPPSHPLPWKHLLGQTEICKPFLYYITLLLLVAHSCSCMTSFMNVPLQDAWLWRSGNSSFRGCLQPWKGTYSIKLTTLVKRLFTKSYYTWCWNFHNINIVLRWLVMLDYIRKLISLDYILD